MDLCVLEETMFRSLTVPDDVKKALEQAIHIETYKGEDSQIEQSGDNTVNIRVRLKDREMFGTTVQYFCFCFGDVPEADSVHEGCIGIPAARFLQAMQRMIHVYASDRASADETFADWGARKGTPFFTEVLDELIVVGPNDLHELLGHKEEYLSLIA